MTKDELFVEVFKVMRILPKTPMLKIEEVVKTLDAGEITVMDASKLLVAMEPGDDGNERQERILQLLTVKGPEANSLPQPAERSKPATRQDKPNIVFPSWLPGAAVVALIVLGVWWFNYSDHAQQVRDDNLIKLGTTSANAMHVSPPRTPDEARLILLQRGAQLDRYIEKKYGPDAQQKADRERDDFERDQQNDSYRE
jgi:hypothetical protein